VFRTKQIPVEAVRIDSIFVLYPTKEIETMASPLTLYLAPNCGLEIEIAKDPIPGSISHPIGSRTYTYTLTDVRSQFHLKEGVEHPKVLQGIMSAMSNITLPPVPRREAGILNKKATQFAYIHPPVGFAAQIEVGPEYDHGDDDDLSHEKEESFEDDNYNTDKKDHYDLSQTDYALNTWALPCFAINGGFVYFDDDLNILAVNAITLQKTKYALRLSGPFKAPTAAIDAMTEKNRIQVMALDALHEISFVAIGWIRPLETFGAQLAPEAHENRHGTCRCSDVVIALISSSISYFV